MYDNKLIFGKCNIENVVSVEPIDGGLILFQEINGEVTNTIIENEYWVLTDKKVSSKQRELEGNQHYKWIATFPTLEQQREVRGILKKNKIDKYDIFNAKEASMVYNGVTYFKGMKPQDVSVLSFDIESTGLVHDKNSRVLLISNTFRKNGKITKKLFAFDDYQTDREMLESWCDWVREMDPAIILGHNILGFDFSYIQYCANKNYARLSLGRDDSDLQIDPYTSKFRLDGSQDLDYYNATIWGREIVDMHFVSRRYDIGKKYESYGLKAIIKHEGLEKKDRQFYDAGEIRNNYTNPEEWKKIKAYAMDDADDTLALFDLMIPATFYFTQSVSKPFQGMINSATGAQLNNLLVRAYLQDGRSIPKSTELTEHVEGGISFAVPGIYRSLMKVDLKSCYPSQVLRFKLYDKIKDPDMYFYKIVHHFTYERFDLKKLYKETNDKYYLDREQTSKIVINSAFGLTNTPGLNFNSPEIAKKITSESRQIIDFALKWASGQGKDYWMQKFNEKVGKVNV